MSLAALILLALKASIVLTVFCIGLNANARDWTYLFRNPGKLVRSLLAMNIVMPLFALFLALVFQLTPALKVALIVLAVAPVPPILPKKIFKAGGGESYTIGLLVTSALLSVFFIPFALEVFGAIFGVPVRMSMWAVASLVLTTVLVPLGAGIAARRIVPDLADRVVKPISILATLMLIAAAIVVLFHSWHSIVALIGNGTIAALVAFICAGIIAGDLLGGSKAEDRMVLALSTASRHPGIAVAIVSVNFPAMKQVTAAILLYLIVNAALAIPYMRWSRRRASVRTGI